MIFPRHDHGATDMSGMDMSGSGTSGEGLDMKMYFHGTIGTDYLWFASWVPTSAGATVGVCFALFFLGVLERYLAAFKRACEVSWQRGLVGFARPASGGGYHLTPSSASSTLSLDHETNTPRQRYTSSITPPEEEDGIAVPTYTSSDTASSAHDEKHIPLTTASASIEQPQVQVRRSGGLGMHLPRAVRAGLESKREGRWSRPWRAGVDIPRGALTALIALLHYILMLAVMTFNLYWLISIVIGVGVGEMLFGRFGSEHHAGH